MCAAKRKPSDDPLAVPAAVIGRLSLYLRELSHFVRAGNLTTNSDELSTRLGLSAAQVRKDLAYFGQFGRPGIGYRCEELIGAIRSILGTDRRWPVLLAGVGNLGRALLGYRGFAPQGFEIVAAVDVISEKVGTEVEGVRVEHLDGLAEIVRREGIAVAILAVPAGSAQAVADRLVAAGVRGIVNFAPVTLSLPEETSLLGVDLAIQLEQVAFSVANRQLPR